MWVEPLALVAGLEASGVQDYALLYSSLHLPYSGRYSLLGWDAAEEVRGDRFDLLAGKLTKNRPPLEQSWIGYFGYGLKDCLERLPKDPPGNLDLPHLWMRRYNHLARFDHELKHVEYSGEFSLNPATITPLAESLVMPGSLRSNMSKADYLDKVRFLVARIHEGEFYQANLTRKFWMEVKPSLSSLALFHKLIEVSPAPYSALLKMDGYSIISSSPEKFLTITADGKIEARPIKGTSARYSDPEKDRISREWLQNSAKNRAENLMIVDLMRHDLSKTTLPGSISVKNPFEVTSYATIHHMASCIQGQRALESTTLDVIQGCFPSGSMTGAPKIRAMQRCTELEAMERGVYSGAIGWLGGDGSADLSVVIRTMILRENYLEFQVGGGIVADSIPEEEWQESLNKARGMAGSLGMDLSELAML